MGASVISTSFGAAGQSFTGRPSRLIVPEGNVVSTDNEEAIRLNPANLAFMPGYEIRYRGTFLRDDAVVPWNGNSIGIALQQGDILGGLESGLLRVDLPFSIAAGLQFDMVVPPGGSQFPKDATYQWLTIAVALAPHRTFSIGGSYQISFSSDLRAKGFNTFSAGVSYRPWSVLGFSVVAEDIGDPTNDFRIVLPSLYHAAFALRPWSTSSIEAAVDFQWMPFASDWGYRANVGVDVGPWARAQLMFAQMATGDDADIAALLGGEFDLSWSEGNVQIGAGGLFGDALTPETFAGGYVTGAVRGWRSNIGVDFHFSVRIRIEETPDSRGHVEILRRLWAAADDPAIDGVVFEARAKPATSLAAIEELRDAFHYIRQRGKKVICSMEDAGGPSLYLCAAADRSYINPSGSIEFAGLSSHYLYFRDLLHQLGIRAEFVRAGAEKAAPEALVRSGPTDVANAAHARLLREFEAELASGIAQGRDIKPEAMRTLLIRGPYMAREAVEDGLVDDYAFDDQLPAKLGEILGHETDVVDYYAPRAPTRFRAAQAIAIIHVDGEMVSGQSHELPFIRYKLSGSYTLARAIRQATARSDIGAIVLRIDTPGGSAMAADVVWREVELAAREKPVVVSMGGVAASGGYYIAAPATEIFANPLSLTGSIGVFAGKVDIEGLMNRLGVTAKIYRSGPRSDANSLFRPYTDSELEVLTERVTRTYNTFLSRVAEGRQMTRLQAHAIGDGKIYTGLEAKKLGLVDEVGGLRQAVNAARDRADLIRNAPIIELAVDDGSVVRRLLGGGGGPSRSEASRSGGNVGDAPNPLALLPEQLVTLLRALAPYALYPDSQPMTRMEMVFEP